MNSCVLAPFRLRAALVASALALLALSPLLSVATGAEREFVGVLAVAVEDDVANQIGLTELQKARLLELVDARENEVVELAMQLKDLPKAEREAKLAPFRRESEEKGLALLSPEQRVKLEQIRIARTGLASLMEPEIARRLQLRPEQQAKAQEILRQRMERTVGADRNAASAIAAQAEDQLAGLLDDQQKESWKAMVSGQAPAPSPANAAPIQAPAPSPADAVPAKPPAPSQVALPAEKPAGAPVAPDSAGPPPGAGSGGPPSPSGPPPQPSGPPQGTNPQGPPPAGVQVPGGPMPFGDRREEFRPGGPRPLPPQGFDDRGPRPEGPRPPFSPDGMMREGRMRGDDGPRGQFAQPAPEGPASPAEGLRFNFRFQPWQDVLQWFADQAGLSLVFETVPQGTFNYTDDREYTPAEAIDLLNSVLLTKGYTLVRKDRMLILINTEDGIPRELVTTVPENELDQRGAYELVSVLFQLSKFAPEEAEKEIQKLIGPQGSVVVLPKSRQILITETAGKLRTIRDVIRRVEDPQGLASGQLQAFELKNIMPEEALTVLRPLLDIPVDGSASSDGALRLALDPVGGRLLATGTPEMLARVEQIIKETDVAPVSRGPAGSNMPPQLQVYAITSADPQSTLSVMQTLLAGLSDVRLAIDPKTNNLIALARPEEHATIKATLEELQNEASRLEVLYLRSLDPTTAVLTIKKMIGDSASDSRAPTVEADTATRRLFIRGTEAQITLIKTFLQQMGEVSLGGPEAMAQNTVRILPLSGRSVESALEQIQQIWPTLRQNKIRVVSPSAMISSMRPSSPETAPQSDQSIFEQLLEQKKIFEVPVSAQESAPPSPTSPPPAQPGAPGPTSNKSTSAEPAGRGAARFMLVSQPVAEESSPKTGPPPAAIQASPSDSPAGQAPSAVQKPQPTKPSKPSTEPAPIVVAVGPSGIMIASEDTEALNQFEELLNSLAGGAGSGEPEMTIFYLTHAKAAVVAETLNQILGSGSVSSSSSRGPGGSLLGDLAGAAIGGTGGRLVSSLLGMGGSGAFTPTGSVRIVPDTRLNALIVEANSADAQMVEQLLKILDQRESPEEILADSKPRLIPVYNTQASEIANIVQQVYRDRMVASSGGGGDRGGGDRPSPEQIMEMLRGSRDGGRGSSRSQAEVPKMSIGVDERTNSLVVSAPDQLFQEVKGLVEELDQAALDSNQSLEVVTLKTISPQVVQQALSSLTGGSVSVRSSGGSSSRSSGSSSGSSYRGPSSFGSSPFSRSPSSSSGSSGPSMDAMRQRMEFFRALQGGGGGGFQPQGGSGGGFQPQGGSGGGFQPPGGGSRPPDGGGSRPPDGGGFRPSSGGGGGGDRGGSSRGRGR